MFGITRKGSGGGPTREQLLAAVPVKNVLVREVVLENGTHSLGTSVLRLTAPLAPQRLRGIFSRGRSEKSFDLDDLGAFVWGAVDGTRSVEALIEYFAAEKRVNIRESEVAVLAFLRTLVQRNLVALAVAGKR